MYCAANSLLALTYNWDWLQVFGWEGTVDRDIITFLKVIRIIVIILRKGTIQTWWIEVEVEWCGSEWPVQA